jgi:hypothetical protein
VKNNILPKEFGEQRKVEEKYMAQQTFSVLTNRPRIVIDHVDGNLKVRSWQRQEIRVDSAEPVVGMRQEGDTLTIADYRGDLTLWVPEVKRGLLSFLTGGFTSLYVSHLSRSATIEGVGNVELYEIGGQVVLENIYGNVKLEGIQELAELSGVGGNLRATNVATLRSQRGVGGNVTLTTLQVAELDNIGGNLHAYHIERVLHVRNVGGNAHARDCAGAEVNVTHTGGNLHIDGAALADSCSAGGNLDVWASVPIDRQVRLHAGGNATIDFPADANVSVYAHAGGNITSPTAQRHGGGSLNLVYGSGQARLDVAVGGNVRLQGEAIPR